MTFTLNKKNRFFYYIAIASISVLFTVFYYNSVEVKLTEELVQQTQIVIIKNNEILLDIINIETGVRGFLLTNKNDFLQPYHEGKNKINKNLETLLDLTKDNPNQQIRIKKLRGFIIKRLDLSKMLINNNNNKKVELENIIRGKIIMDSIRQNIKTINSEELSLLKQHKNNNLSSSQLSKVLLFGLFLFLLILVFFIYYLFKNHNKRNLELELFNTHQKEASQYSLSLIEASLDPLVTINNEGKITDLNQATVNVTGIAKEDLIGSDFFDYFTDHQKAREVYQDVFSKGSVIDAPLTIRHKEGKLIDVLFNGSIYKDELGSTKGVVIVARDIAEQKWAMDLRDANNELAFQNEEKEKRAEELALANKELEYQNSEKEDRANELLIANEELAFQNQEKENRANELLIANKELEYQNKIKGKKAAELVIANKELAFQNKEKEKRANELEIANKELLFQKDEKQNRADELGIANIELAFQQSEKQDRADELGIADIELNFQNKEKEKRIIESKKLEAYNYSLKLTSQYSRSLIEASLDPLVTISVEGKITDVNNASVKVTGVERENLVGTDFSNYFTEPKKAQEGYRKVFENGYVEDYPLTIKHINGKLIDVLYNASVYKDDNNKVLGVFASARDITEQNKQKLKNENANKNLEESNNSLKLASQYSLSLIEASRDPLFTISKEGVITDTNQASVRTTGVSKEQLIGSNFINYFTEPDKAEKGYKEVFSNEYVIDYPLVIKDHKLTDVLFNGSVYRDENNIVIGAVVVARDVTEHKIAEKKLLDSLKEITDYKFALDASTIVDITDKNGIIVFVNENYTKISNYSFDELVGGTHNKVNSEYHDNTFMSGLWNDISKGKIWQNEIRNKNKAGEYYWLNMTIVPFLDEKGIPYQYVCISIDVTNQKTLEKELTKAKDFAEFATTIAQEAKIKAEESVKSKQQFLSNMSHEIRTPMNAIIGFTKVVLKTELTTKQKEYLMAIKMSGDALIVLINDILDLAKVDAGKMTFEKIPFKLYLSIKAMLHLFETKIQEKNLKLVTIYDKNIPEVLVGDPVRLHQIILNLVSNAVKFTNKGKITVSVNLVSDDEKSVSIKFAVTDTGIGIKEKKIENIFENFQQATSGTSRIYGGTGLGLAIVRQLVEAQNGKIEVESEFDKGSTFSFILDFIKTTADAIFEPENIELNTDIKDIKILVVEDMELNQLLMRTLLDDFGFDCEIASNGKIAIEKLEEKEFDIILMDLQMPEMNGFDATDYIRNTMKLSVPIIALTADVTTVDVAKCKEVGMNDYISKPVDERLLYSKLIGLMKKPVLIIENIKGQKPAKDTIKYVDMSYLEKLTKSDPKLMNQMINAYLVQTPPLILAMKKSLKDKDWKMLQSAVHKMIPSFSIIGLSPSIHEIAKRIQEYAYTIEITEEIHSLVEELGEVCTQSCEELEIELNNINNI
ncbi:PAS domain S-box protein [Flavobacterium psychrophilum]|uniref:PAS domain S-box protein n=1 Tax=Flavobacterium psychrophilum TaxID=96345 RepID=UPI0009098C31|nr:PAS domain S-box protein [Flavobacterium psychrophilum]EKT2072625.1 PAS domain S-box protein [Flavobacterium psychrophilum]EKT4492138.1 PAS domain S-box protein [Flavobacterium psychrophilum]SHH92884.1 Probable hybrid two-component system sensor histidine kinase and response regulator receiver [Flavobacterium psychrophilum]